MPPRRPPIEPGLLRVFLVVLAIQWSLLTLGICGALAKPKGVPDLSAVLNWAQSGLLMLYLCVGARRWRRWRPFLPLALVVAAVGPVAWQPLATLVRLAYGLRGAAALDDPNSLCLWLLLPWLLICAQYGLRALYAFTAGTSLLALLLAIPFALDGVPALSPTATAAAGRFVVFSLVGSILVPLSKAQRAQREEEVAKRLQLAQFATTLEQLAATRERNRLARDLHDTLAHTLSAVSVQLKALDVLWDRDPEAARRTLRATHELTRTGLDEARRALHALRTGAVEELGLTLALRRAAEQAAERAQARLEFAAPDQLSGLRADVEQHLYRIGEEALNNTARHARARTLRVALARRGGGVELTVADDGAGFDADHLGAPRAGHFGLTGMRERAALIDATLEVRSAPGRGTVVTVRV
jgi:signal transduction histidine kinase